jgi:hypothetical protein
VTSSPPQFGQRPSSAVPHDVQNVHSKLQISASALSGVRAVAHRSHSAFIISMRTRNLPPDPSENTAAERR